MAYQQAGSPGSMPRLIFFEKGNTFSAVTHIDSDIVYGRWRQAKDTIILQFNQGLSGMRKGKIERQIFDRFSYISISFSDITYSQITKQPRKHTAPVRPLMFL